MRSKIGALILACLGLAAPTSAQYWQLTYDKTLGVSSHTVSGYFKVAASSLTANSHTIVLDGVTGGINASSGTFTYRVKAGSATFTSNVEIASATLTINGTNANININSNGSNLAPNFYSGNAANYMEFGLGAGTSANHGIGVNDSGTQLNGNASAGDLVMRTITASKKIVMAYNPTGRLGFQYDGVNDQITIGNSSSGVALILSGRNRLLSRTKAQIDAITPGAVGEELFCSDCAVPDVCVSTGTSVAQFRRVGNTNGCGSGN